MMPLLCNKDMKLPTLPEVRQSLAWDHERARMSVNNEYFLPYPYFKDGYFETFFSDKEKFNAFWKYWMS